MSRSVVELYENNSDHDEALSPFALLPLRSQMLSKLKEGAAIDVVCVGSDLPLALSAHLLALNGVRVVVLCPGPFDYVGGRSVADLATLFSASPFAVMSRSVKQARRFSHLRRLAPHRVFQSSKILAHVAGVGAAHSQRKYSYIEKFLRTIGGFTVVDDGACVAEAFLAARREGVSVISHCEPLFMEVLGESGIKIVGVRDLLTGDLFECKAGSVVIGHGVAAPPSRLRAAVKKDGVSPETGTPRGTKGDVVVRFECSGQGDQVPNQMEVFFVDGSLPIVSWNRPVGGVHVSAHLPKASAARWPKVEAFVRARFGVPIKIQYDVVPTDNLSSQVNYSEGTLQLPSSSPLAALAIADALSKIYLHASGKSAHELVRSQSLSNPGALRGIRVGALTPFERFSQAARAAKVHEDAITRAYQRWGDRVRYIDEFTRGFEFVTPELLWGELAIAVLADQVCHACDLPLSLLRLTNADREAMSILQREIDQLLRTQHDLTELSSVL